MFPESCLLYKYIVLAQEGGEGMVKAAGGKSWGQRARTCSWQQCKLKLLTKMQTVISCYVWVKLAVYPTSSFQLLISWLWCLSDLIANWFNSLKLENLPGEKVYCQASELRVVTVVRWWEVCIHVQQNDESGTWQAPPWFSDSWCHLCGSDLRWDLSQLCWKMELFLITP